LTKPVATFGEEIKKVRTEPVLPFESDLKRKIELNGIKEQEEIETRTESGLLFERQMKKNTGLNKIVEQEIEKPRAEPNVIFQKQLKKKTDSKGSIEQEIKKIKTEPLVTFEVIELIGRKNTEAKSLERVNDVIDVSVYKGVEKHEKEIIPGLKEIEESNQYRKSSYIQEAENILRKLSKDETANDNEKVTLQNATNKFKEDKLVENGTRKEDKLDENQIENILLKSIKTKDGLKEIIKKLFKGK